MPVNARARTYVLIHVFGTARDELDRHPLERKTFTGWLRAYVPFAERRWSEIARVVDILAEHGWKTIGSPYDCDLLVEKETSRTDAEQELRRLEVWDRIVQVASPDDDGHPLWAEHPEGRPMPRRRRRVRRPPTREEE